MKATTLLSLGILTMVTSCTGQPSNQHKHTIYAAKGDTVNELGSNIMSVYQDKKNVYWFGSWETGVYRYDGETMVNYTKKHGLPSNRVDEIKEDKFGNIYFKSSGDIVKFDGHDFTEISLTSNSNSEWKLAPDDLWFRSYQDVGCVYRYDGQFLHRLTFPETKDGDDYFAKFPNVNYSPYDVYTIYKDSKGNVWFGTAALGVCLYDGETFTWISEEELEFDIETAFGIRSIMEDNKGKFWFSNSQHRFDVYSKDNTTHYSKEPGMGSLDGKENGDLVAIIAMEKDDNDLWMATYDKGVYCYNGQQITHYPVKHHGKDITVFSIYKDNQGDLWLGTHEHGAFKFNGQAFERFLPQ